MEQDEAFSAVVIGIQHWLADIGQAYTHYFHLETLLECDSTGTHRSLED